MFLVQLANMYILSVSSPGRIQAKNFGITMIVLYHSYSSTCDVCLCYSAHNPFACSNIVIARFNIVRLSKR